MSPTRGVGEVRMMEGLQLVGVIEVLIELENMAAGEEDVEELLLELEEESAVDEDVIRLLLELEELSGVEDGIERAIGVTTIVSMAVVVSRKLLVAALAVWKMTEVPS